MDSRHSLFVINIFGIIIGKKKELHFGIVLSHFISVVMRRQLEFVIEITLINCLFIISVIHRLKVNFTVRL